MRLSASFCLLAILPAVSLAAPVEPPKRGMKIPLSKRHASFVQEDGVVNLSALANHMAISTAKISRGFSIFETNTGTVHSLAALTSEISSTLSSIFSRRSTGSVPLADESQIMWTGNLTVGTPPQSFTIDFDTGSSDMFLAGSSCGSTCAGRSLYDPSASSTATDLGKNFTLNYGDGSQVQGRQWSDTVTVQGLTTANQTVGAASTYSTSFQMDGLVGLGFQSISVYNQPPLFQSLISAGQLDSSVFSFKLSSSDSELFLGGTNDALFTGDITYADVTQQGYWQVQMDGLSLGSSDNTTEIRGSTAAIIDSGTTLILGDSASVAAFYGNVTGAKEIEGQSGMWSVPCGSVPTASMSFGGVSFEISPETFSLGLVESGSSDCVGGIASTSTSFWIVGDVFMQNVYSVFDVEQSRVGFATLA